MAEFTVGLILTVLRKISQADRSIREGIWKRFMGNLLAKQTVGLIGYGRIGKRVSKLLRAFGSKILVYDIQKAPADADVNFLPFEEILVNSDIISLHLPYDPSTHHLLNRERVGMMKRGAILINASRGGLVDEDTIVDALREGHLAGVGFDTFEEEPYKGPLTAFEQVVLTSHMGSSAKEAKVSMEQEAAENLMKGLIEKGIITD